MLDCEGGRSVAIEREGPAAAEREGSTAAERETLAATNIEGSAEVERELSAAADGGGSDLVVPAIGSLNGLISCVLWIPRQSGGIPQQ